MNYLAHLYLSGESEKLLVGNFIGDYVKGKQYQHYPDEIARGILLHRRIDSFTDAHELHRAAKHFFRAEFGHYAGIVVDVVYDHFLAGNWKNYSDISLRWFAKWSHSVLLANFKHLPLRVQGFLPFLIQHRRLESYATIEGITQALNVMGKYSSLPAKSELAKQALLDNYPILQTNFEEFMGELIQYVSDEFGIALNQPKKL
ncbi:ACP phosphodiesterase [Maribellus sediminis]|uniref:acyl carrier protein phosphodiesterase n=1 Tax=Maribellus sediminis TaxID=2696285 RepID=UPI0014301508|nr:ACP phosphodiesterase [Maribellus sediminis]